MDTLEQSVEVKSDKPWVKSHRISVKRVKMKPTHKDDGFIDLIRIIVWLFATLVIACWGWMFWTLWACTLNH